MLMMSLALQANRPLARRFAHALGLLKVEYDRAMLASSCYHALKGRGIRDDRHTPHEVRDISREVFNSFYSR